MKTSAFDCKSSLEIDSLIKAGEILQVQLQQCILERDDACKERGDLRSELGAMNRRIAVCEGLIMEMGEK